MSRFKGNAAITWSSTGDTNTERVHLLDVPLRELKAAHTLTEFSRESLDKSTIETFTVGSGAYELVGSVRFEADPSSLIDLIVAGSQGRTLTYYPDLNDPDVSYGCLLVSPRSPTDLGLDAQRPGDSAIELRLRRTDETAFHPLGIQTNILFWYRAGDALTGYTYSGSTGGSYAAVGYGTLSSANALARVDWQSTDPNTGPRTFPTLLLEEARTNLVTASEDFSGWTSVNSPTLTSAQTDPRGGSAAWLVADDSTVNTELIRLAWTPSSAGQFAYSAFFRQSTAPSTAGTTLRIRDITTTQTIGAVTATWSSGIPSLTFPTGTSSRPAERYRGDWWRVSAVTTTGISTASTHAVEILPADDLSTGSVYAFGVQVE